MALPEGFEEFDMFAFGTALLFGGVLGFFLNLASALAFLRVKELRTPNNFLVFNLALADMSLTVNGLIAAYASYLRGWPYGQDGCTYHGFQGMISILASISFMATVAWDRYHQYCTRQKFFWSTAIFMCAVIWGLSIFWAALPLYGYGVYDFEPMKVCCTLDYTKNDSNYSNYLTSLVVVYLLFPTITLMTSYEAIFLHFKKLHNYRFNTSLPLRVLFMCWGPYIILCIYACFDNVTFISPKLRMVLPVLAKTNPIFNALLYSFGNEFYRPGLWNFLTGEKIVETVIKLKGR